MAEVQLLDESASVAASVPSSMPTCTAIDKHVDITIF